MALRYQNKLFIFFMILAEIMLLVQVFSVTTITHDSAISLIAATGHQADYALNLPKNRWVAVSELQKYWQTDQFGIFRIIAKDLAEYDIHPPLFFWALHLWTFIFGVHLYTGPLLNSIFHLATALLIYYACDLMNCKKHWSATLAIVWMMSGSFQLVSLETRQYTLLGLLSILFITNFIKYCLEPTMLKLVLFAVSMVMGLLTHYYFSLIIAAIFFWGNYYFLRKFTKREVLIFNTSFLVSGILFVLLNPYCLSALLRHSPNANALLWSDIPRRFIYGISSFVNILLPHNINASQWLSLSFIVIILAIAIKKILLSKEKRRLHLGSLFELDGLSLYICVGLSVFYLLLFIVGISPIHGYGAKYIMFFIPCFFLVMGGILSKIKIANNVQFFIAVILIGSQLVYTTSNMISIIQSEVRFGAFSELSGTIPIVIDTTKRGLLPIYLFNEDPDRLVYVSEQKHLAQTIQDIVGFQDFYFISSHWYENNQVTRDQIFDELKIEGYHSEVVKDNPYIYTGVYYFTSR